MIRQGFFLFITSLLLAGTVHAAPRGDVYDVLDTPAAQSSRAAQSRLFGLARAGDRLVAVGAAAFSTQTTRATAGPRHRCR